MSKEGGAKNANSFPKKKNANEVVGEVISTRSKKSISVLIYRLMKHPKYKKYIRRTSVFKAHDKKEEAKEGDRVKIFETRPLSKTKRWCLEKVLSRNEGKDSKSQLNKDFGEKNIMEGLSKKEKPETQTKDRVKKDVLKVDDRKEAKKEKEEGTKNSTFPIDGDTDKSLKKARDLKEEKKEELSHSLENKVSSKKNTSTKEREQAKSLENNKKGNEEK